MKGKWEVYSNVIGGKTVYMAKRLRDAGGVEHSGNLEGRGDWTEDREAVERLCETLNQEEAG